MIDPPAPVTRRHFVQGVAATAALGALASWPARLMAAGGAQSELSGTEFDLEIAENDPDKLVDIIASLEPTSRPA